MTNTNRRDFLTNLATGIGYGGAAAILGHTYFPSFHDYTMNAPAAISYDEFEKALKADLFETITINDNNQLELLTYEGRRLSVNVPEFANREELFQKIMRSNAAVWSGNESNRDGHHSFHAAALGTAGAGIGAILAAHKIYTTLKSHFSLVKTPCGDSSTAYHEAGHALYGILKPGSEPLVYVTIKRRKGSLGHAFFEDPEPHTTQTYKQFKNDLGTIMAGRAAEIVIFGKDNIRDGATGDMAIAKIIAQTMVMELGMSEKIGPLQYDRTTLEQIFGLNAPTPKKAEEIEEEVTRLVKEALEDAVTTLETHKDALILIANELLEHERLDAARVKELAGIVETEDKAPAPPHSL